MSVHVDLSGISKTLLLPLLGRAHYSRQTNPFIRDELAIEITESLEYNFSELLANIGDFAPLWWAVRAYRLDGAIMLYLAHHPEATIVNLGAGLDTAFHRVDNGRLTWFDLDVPQAMELRTQLIPGASRCHNIEKSILDFSWMDDLQYDPEKGLFFFAGGLFMYFKEDEVKTIFTQMSQRFPGSELVFDAISPRGVIEANKMVGKDAKMENATMHWGIQNAKTIAEWDSKIAVLDQHGYFKGIKFKHRLPLKFYLPMILSDLTNSATFIHLGFKSDS